MARRKECWKVFYLCDRELCAYTVKDTFDGEEESTKQFLALENGVAVEDIQVRIERR